MVKGCAWQYIPVGPGQDSLYETPLLPGFKLDVGILWREQLPDYFEIGRAVQEMVGQS
ncbi:MAG: hypothetical protein P8Z40_14980 [Chloroflexota bacterium]|jgi:hypothetical protein